MSLLAYAVAEGDAGAIDGAGLDGRPLVTIGHGDVALVVSRQSSPLAEPTAQTLWRYEEIVERLMESQPILPARFGSVLEDEDAARNALRARHDELRRGLDRVRDAVEFGIRGSWTQAPTGRGAQSGTEYMLAQLDIRRRAERVADRVEPLRRLARATKIKVLPRPSVPFLGAYLLDSGRTEEFIQRATECGGGFDDGELVWTGPWPPYSFAEAATLDRVTEGGRR